MKGKVIAGRNGGSGVGEVGKVERPRSMDKQRKLVLEEGKGKKKVTFSEEEGRKEGLITIGREEWEELKRDLRELKEKWVECKEWIKELNEKEKE